MHDPYAIRRMGTRPASVPGVPPCSDDEHRSHGHAHDLTACAVPDRHRSSPRRLAPPSAHRMLDAAADVVYRSGPPLRRAARSLMTAARRAWIGLVKRYKS